MLISTAPGRQFFLADILNAWRTTHRPFFLLARSRRLLKRGQREHWRAKKTLLPILPTWLFLILVPVLWPCFGLVFLIRLWRLKPASVLLINWPEKILFSPLVSLSKTRLVWLEYPEYKNNFFPLLNILYRRAARRAIIVVFSQSQAEQFRSFVAGDRIAVVPPAALVTAVQQDTLFKTLANKTERGRFVVGSVLYGLPKDQAERLLSALSIAQSVCPFIELVIVGEGKNRRQIQWIIKRMNLERRVWLAGASADFSRWFSHLDLYIMASTRPTLEDAAFGISALASGLPVIGPEISWLQDVISPKVGALIDINDPELIAHQCISFQQAGEKQKAIAESARAKAQELSFERLMEKLTHIIYEVS